MRLGQGSGARFGPAGCGRRSRPAGQMLVDAPASVVRYEAVSWRWIGQRHCLAGAKRPRVPVEVGSARRSPGFRSGLVLVLCLPPGVGEPGSVWCSPGVRVGRGVGGLWLESGGRRPVVVAVGVVEPGSVRCSSRLGSGLVLVRRGWSLAAGGTLWLPWVLSIPGRCGARTGLTGRELNTGVGAGPAAARGEGPEAWSRVVMGARCPRAERPNGTRFGRRGRCRPCPSNARTRCDDGHADVGVGWGPTPGCWW
jgi:hypothetical protein